MIRMPSILNKVWMEVFSISDLLGFYLVFAGHNLIELWMKTVKPFEFIHECIQ